MSMIYPFLSSVSEYSADFLSIAPVFPSIASVLSLFPRRLKSDIILTIE